ncbi:MAG: hydroxymethylpyrimidine/phosphomethylpyrimidine kinase [Pseudohongiellaceae bacterium]|jgi:hydroxymethylpyrimidine/phosphomethylpyrimidine kinase
MSSNRPAVPLTIAGSDPSGGAGIQADLKVFLRFGLSGASVPTALTVQSPTGVKAIEAVDAKLVKRQLDALLMDFRPAAVKVGMLPSAAVVRVVARALTPLMRKKVPIIIDPVLQASSGARVLPRKDVAIFLRHLAPLATLITPNVTEAAELSGLTVSAVRRNTQDVIKVLLRAGPKAVLVKGGHLSGDESVDILGFGDEVVMYSLPRVPRRRRVHGTGCALSSAITALMAQKISLEDSVEMGKRFVTSAIAGARYVGRGSRQLDFTADVPMIEGEGG